MRGLYHWFIQESDQCSAEAKIERQTVRREAAKIAGFLCMWGALSGYITVVESVDVARAEAHVINSESTTTTDVVIASALELPSLAIAGVAGWATAEMLSLGWLAYKRQSELGHSEG